jgi:hypothetical protein
MKNIKRTSLVLTIFSLFLCLTTVAQAQGKATLINKYCPQTTKELQKRIKSVKKVHKGMYNGIFSPLSSSHIDRYNRHVNILEGNLDREVQLMKGLLEKAEQQGRKCQEMAQGLSPHIDKIHGTQTRLHAAIFDSNTIKYKKLIEKLGGEVKDISGELEKHLVH